MKNKKQKKMVFILWGFALAFILYLFFVPKTIQIRSNAHGVNFVTNKELITDVEITAPFLYSLIPCDPKEHLIRDLDGTVTEIIQTYKIEAKLSFQHKNSMKIHFDINDTITHTYILKFADKDITITNGEAVKQ